LYTKEFGGKIAAYKVIVIFSTQLQNGRGQLAILNLVNEHAQTTWTTQGGIKDCRWQTLTLREMQIQSNMIANYLLM
jgi:hypothetical protein